MNDKRRYYIPAVDIEASKSEYAHPLNPNSQMIGTQLSSLTGLSRIGVDMLTLPPGKESCVYHSHDREEEWIYVLAGRGRARIDGAEFEVGPGDFMGFPTPGVAHHLVNPFEEPLTYLVGGEHHDYEIVDFPDLGKRMVRRGDTVEIFNSGDAKSWGDALD